MIKKLNYFQFLPSITRSPRCLMRSRVPLHSPFEGSILRSRIMRTPTFRTVLCRGNRGILIPLRYSIGISSMDWPLSSKAWSALRKTVSSPGHWATIFWLSSLTDTLWGARIALLSKYWHRVNFSGLSYPGTCRDPSSRRSRHLEEKERELQAKMVELKM